MIYKMTNLFNKLGRCIYCDSEKTINKENICASCKRLIGITQNEN